MARRRNSKARKMREIRIAIVMAIVIAAFAFRAISRNEQQPNAYDNESVAVNDRVSTDSLLVVRTNPALKSEIVRYTGMDLSFNSDAHEPNWVAWELTADETTGPVKRSSKFIADIDVAGSAMPSDYTNSGYDRGHKAPAGDMKWSPEAMQETFYMTNICPQAKPLNTGAWKNLEEKCRVWACAEGAVYIVCGPVLTDGMSERIGESGVVVPKRFFKVVLAPNADPPRGIGFLMDNAKVKGGMQAAATSIDEVERVTGHDFFSSLPDEIEDAVEAQNDFNLWNTVK